MLKLLICVLLIGFSYQFPKNPQEILSFPDICGLEEQIKSILDKLSPQGQASVQQTIKSLNQYLRIEAVQVSSKLLQSKFVENLKQNFPNTYTKLTDLFGFTVENNGRLVVGLDRKIIDLCEYAVKIEQINKEMSQEGQLLLQNILNEFNMEVKKRLPSILSQAVSDNRNELNKLLNTVEAKEVKGKIQDLMFEFLFRSIQN